MIIAGIEIEIKEVDNLVDENGDELDGLALPEQGIIQINRNRHPSLKGQTRLHEIIHMIAYYYEWKAIFKSYIPEDKWDDFEELMCCVLAPCIYDTTMRNSK